MLVYFNRSFFRVILCRYGSIFLRTDSVSIGLSIAGVAAVMQHLIDVESPYAPEFPHHYSMLTLGGVVAFAVVFRTNLGWSRYWEAIGQLHTMYSKWGDTFMQIIAFASVSVENARSAKTEVGEAKAKRIEDLVEQVYRNFAILSAIAADRLTHGDTSRMERRAEAGAAWSRQLVKREELRGGPDLTGATRMPQFDVPDAPQADPFEQRPSNPQPLIRRLSGFSRVKTSEMQNTWRARYRVRAYPSKVQYDILQRSTDRTSVMLYLIIQDLAQLSCDLEAAPPIQSRMYQQLSDGMLGFSQAMKLSDVPFPFPYAQMLTLLLICYTCFIPVYIVAFTSSMIAGPIMSFALFQGVWGLNETAKELENPFGKDVNDITLGDFHMRFLDGIDQVFFACTLRSSKKAAVLEAEQRGQPDVKDIPVQPEVQSAHRGGQQANESSISISGPAADESSASAELGREQSESLAGIIDQMVARGPVSREQRSLKVARGTEPIPGDTSQGSREANLVTPLQWDSKRFSSAKDGDAVEQSVIPLTARSDLPESVLCCS